MGLFDWMRRAVPAPTALGRATRALERGRLDEAAAALEDAFAAARGPELALVRNKRAILALRQGDREAALAELAEALAVEPRSPAPVVTLGNLLLEDGDVGEAIEHYEAALRLDDAYAPAYHNLGVALRRVGRRGEAVRMLRKAARLERTKDW